MILFVKREGLSRKTFLIGYCIILDLGQVHLSEFFGVLSLFKHYTENQVKRNCVLSINVLSTDRIPIVWQRFYEPVRLKIAHWSSVFHVCLVRRLIHSQHGTT